MTGKRSPRASAAGTPAPTLSADVVARYLRGHPEFLLEHPELLSVLTPPAQHSGDNVTDLGRFMVRRLQEETQRLKEREGALLEVSRVNQAAQDRVHRAALALLDARNFQHLIHIVTRDLADLLDVDVVTLCVEAQDDDGPRQVTTNGVYLLEAGTIDMLLGPRENVYLGTAFAGQEAVFGPASGLVRSLALVRLATNPECPVGLMALGSRDLNKFQSGQRAELLGFLARLLERLLRAWLDLPD